MMQVEFCPICDMRLRLGFRSRGALYCPTCGYKKEFPDDYVPEVQGGEDFDDGVVVLDSNAMALLTHPTVRAYCEECGSRKSETWTVAFGSGTVSSIIFYRCLRCGHTWRDIE